MLMIMTSVAAETMRATKSTLPGYGVSSSLSHCQSHVRRPFATGKACAIDAISMPANHHDCRLAHPKQICGRVLDAHPNRITGRQMHPVQRPLHIRQTLSEAANNVCVWSHTKSDAVHHSRKAHVRFGHDIDVRPHSGRNALELSFAKIGD